MKQTPLNAYVLSAVIAMSIFSTLPTARADSVCAEALEVQRFVDKHENRLWRTLVLGAGSVTASGLAVKAVEASSKNAIRGVISSHPEKLGFISPKIRAGIAKHPASYYATRATRYGQAAKGLLGTSVGLAAGAALEIFVITGETERVSLIKNDNAFLALALNDPKKFCAFIDEKPEVNRAALANILRKKPDEIQFFYEQNAHMISDAKELKKPVHQQTFARTAADNTRVSRVVRNGTANGN